MAEHEIAKHTKAIYKAWNEPNWSWKHKAVEVSIEIGIIVFAITLSLFLERWREHVHEREIEKQFLTGLKSDLILDVAQQSGDSVSYSKVLPAWAYFRKSGLEKHLVPNDTLNAYVQTLFTTIGFIPNSSRFEALKSSGELGVIQNQELQNKILDLYQYRIRTLLVSTDFFTTFQENQIFPYMAEKMVLQPNGVSNLNEILQLPRMQNLLIYGNSTLQILSRYHDVMMQSREIIGLIDQQYNLQINKNQ
jgi:hypothetical protein